MDLKTCYMHFGGDYDAVLGRLRREEMIKKFVYKFLEDKNFQLLELSIKNKNYEDALGAVHTIKGICQNLSFTRLFESSNAMTELFKAGNYEKAVAMMPQVSDDYFSIIRAVEEYKTAEGAQ